MAQTSYSNKQGTALAGQLADLENHVIISRANGESSAEIPFGVAVCIGASDTECALPAASSAKILGVAVHSHAEPVVSSSGVTGYTTDRAVSILRQGKIYVIPEDAVAEGGAVYVRYAGSGQKGAFLGTDDGSNSALLANAIWRTTATAAIAELELLGPVQAMS